MSIALVAVVAFISGLLASEIRIRLATVPPPTRANSRRRLAVGLLVLSVLTFSAAVLVQRGNRPGPDRGGASDNRNVAPAPPVRPMTPAVPVTPVTPVVPVQPTPTPPVKPVKPVTPTVPTKPVKPTKPAVPVKPITSPAREATVAQGAVAVAYALRQVGKPYRFGAAGPRAFDCSGLVMRAWQIAGVKLPRTSRAQARTGLRITRAQLRPGDLVLTNRFGHVQLYIGDGKIVAADRPGTVVRIRPLPAAGRVDAYVRVTTTSPKPAPAGTAAPKPPPPAATPCAADCHPTPPTGAKATYPHTQTDGLPATPPHCSPPFIKCSTALTARCCPIAMPWYTCPPCGLPPGHRHRPACPTTNPKASQ